ncbi:MAG TPA: hypothetical protein VFA56_03620 [Gaiellaceae bacterium]|nr:hypothetical protein [Gaiellaceae bacterium]
MIGPAQHRRRRPRRPWLPWLAGLVGVLLVLAVGIAVGMALQDNPAPGLTITTTKTLVP